ncbi:MAG: UPF0146 family protein [Halobacteria archaeon]|nr:UPF0146 family protein [Halobacteria archaeon]
MNSEEVAEYVSEEYSGKVVEVGVGRRYGVARSLAERGFDVTVTDVYAREEFDADTEGVEYAEDDVREPRLSVYEGASLIYSVRLPPELHPYLDDVAREVGADLLVVPLGNEGTPLDDVELVNRGASAFYLGRRE